MDKCLMTLPVLLLFLGLVGISRSCLNPVSAYRFTGAVCRLTYSAAVVLNEKTTKVIQADPGCSSMNSEKSILFVGKVKYGLTNLEIHNLSIGRSEFELKPGKGIEIAISKVSAVSKGTIQYENGSCLVNVGHSVDLEIESHIDLGINPKLYCGKENVAADTSVCYLTIHKLNLLLLGDKEPGWLKRLFTDFITFTVKLVIKSQICKEINNVANILADFIQERAEQFLSDGDISMNIGVTSAPVITSQYIKSYHKGLAKYNNVTAVINASVFHPSQLTEDRMLYFWISDEVFNPLITASHQDGRFVLNISGLELTVGVDLTSGSHSNMILCGLLSSEEPFLRVWRVSVPQLWTTPLGISVRALAAGKLTSGAEDIPGLSFETVSQPNICRFHDLNNIASDNLFSQISKLEQGLTALMDKQGANLFDIIKPQVVSQDGYVIIQTDFGFPHHLFVEFLRKTLE
uniref:Cholesteryl ester transfer protein n=1 Tax=Oncorhynchus kisutch TaxID=8019 RepID=A0A8C7CLM3_ONCKI